jgi:tetratricopeptide (TPR) repeat protein
MFPKIKKDIPPGLVRIVKGQKASKKSIFIIGASLFAVIIGFALVFIYNYYLSDNLKKAIQTHKTTPVIQQKPEMAKAENKTSEEPVKTIQAETIKETTNKAEVKPLRKTTKKNVQISKQFPEAKPNESIAKINKPEEVSIHSLDTFKGADFLYRAQDFEQKGLLSDAVNEYKEYINYTGKADGKILNKIATLYLLMGNIKDANHYAELAFQQNKNSKEISINYGVIKAKMGELDKAEELFMKVLSIEPENKKALFNLALLKEKKGDYKEAFKLYEKLYQLGDTSVAISLERLKAFK